MTRAKGINWASDFAVLAHRYEERIAVSDRHGTVTYGALFARATSIAQALSQRGIGPRSVVATMFRNDRHAVAGMLATMLTGSTEVPLNPALSQADREHCCSVAGVEMVLTSETLADSSLNDLGDVMTVEAISPAISDVIMLPNCDPNSPPRIVFTSGTTGKPKGAVHSQHGRWTANLLLCGSLPQRPKAGSRILLMTPFSHGSSLMTHAYLSSGASVELRDAADPQIVLPLLQNGSWRVRRTSRF